MQLYTSQLPAVQGTYVPCVLLIRTCCTCTLLVAVAQLLPLLPPLLPPPGQLVHQRPLLLLIEYPTQLYICAALPFSFSNTSFLYIVFYFHLQCQVTSSPRLYVLFRTACLASSQSLAYLLWVCVAGWCGAFHLTKWFPSIFLYFTLALFFLLLLFLLAFYIFSFFLYRLRP